MHMPCQQDLFLIREGEREGEGKGRGRGGGRGGGRGEIN